MAYKKQLRDKDGNVVYPDVGLNLDDVVYSDDPTEPVGSHEPWIETGDIKDNAVTSDKINNGAVTADKIDFTTIVYPDFYYSGAFGGTAGFSQTRTITLPRAVKANERCVIMSNSKWCIINASPVDSGATTVNVDICPPITSANSCEFRLTAMYYTL